MFLSCPSASYPETFSPALETHYPWSEKENVGDLYYPVMASYGSVYLIRKNHFRRLRAGAVFQLDVFVVNCMHLCVAFLMAPARVHSQQFERFGVVFSRDYLRTCPLIAAQGCVHVRLVPVWPINGHMLPTFGEARLVAPS